MSTSRRQFLIGAGTAASASLVLPRKGWAPPPPAQNGLCAVHFDGATRMECPSSSLGFPTQGQYLFGAVRFNASVLKNDNYTMVDLGNPTLAGSLFNLAFLGGTRSGQFGVQISVEGGGKGLGVKSPSGSIPNTGWHLLKYGIDTGAGIILADLDNAPIPGLTYVAGSGNSFYIPFQTVGSLPLYWEIGRTVLNQSTWLTGDLTDTFVAATPAFVDPTSQAMKNAFTDPATGVPVHQALSGRGILSNDELPGIWLTCGTQYYPGNYVDYPWTETGAFAVTGNLTPAVSGDPWESVGET